MAYDGGELNVEIQKHEQGMVVRPEGFIDLSRSPALRTAIAEAQRSKPGRLVIDLTDVDYMDSSGVATCVEALQLARAGGSRLVLCCMQERVRSIFEIARLDMVFTIVPDLDAAFAD